MKRFLTIILTLIMVTSAIVPALAAERETTNSDDIAFQTAVAEMTKLPKSLPLSKVSDKSIKLVKISENKLTKITEYKKVELHKHEYVAHIVEPTCTSMGYTNYICSTCGKTYTDNWTDKTDHAWNEWSITVDITTSNDGEKCRTCSVCSEEETAIIPRVIYASKSNIWSEEASVTPIDETLNENNFENETEYAYTLEIPKLVSSKESDVVSIPVYVYCDSDKIDHFNTLDIKFNFDASILEFVSIDNSECYVRTDSNSVRIMRFGANSDFGKVFSLNFKIIGDGNTEISISSAKIDNSENAVNSDARDAIVLNRTSVISVES